MKLKNNKLLSQSQIIIDIIETLSQSSQETRLSPKEKINLIKIFSVYQKQKVLTNDLIKTILSFSFSSKIEDVLVLFARLFAHFEKIMPLNLIKTPDDIFNRFRSLSTNSVEVLRAVYLNVKNEIIFSKNISIGTYNSLVVSPCDVLHYAVKTNSRHFVLIHNHPSGDSTPSEQDIIFTKKIKKAADLLGVSLIDHLILGFDKYYSFKQNDLL